MLNFLRRRTRPVLVGDPLISCLSCGISHRLPMDPRQRIASEQGFADRHLGHNLTFGAVIGFTGNADVKLALQAVQTFTVTSLHSLASSATAGWQSAAVDNTSNLFFDDHVQVVLDFANTAPSNSKGAYVYAAGGIESGVLSNPASGSEGGITLTDVTSTALNLRQIGFIPYTTQDEVAESSPMSVAAGFGGMLPAFWSVAIINHSGAALAGSGNTVKHRGMYSTVV